MPLRIDSVTACTLDLQCQLLLNGENFNFYSELTKSFVYVSPNGNDSTGKRGNPDRPFLTFLAASNAAISGDTVIVFPGQYNNFDPNGSQTIHKDGVNWHFMPGSKYYVSGQTGTNSTGALFRLDNSNVNLRITGYLEYKESSTGPDTSNCEFQFILNTGSGNTIYVEAQSIETQSGTIILFNTNGGTSESGKVKFTMFIRDKVVNNYPGTGQSGFAQAILFRGQNFESYIEINGLLSNNRVAPIFLRTGGTQMSNTNVTITAKKVICTGDIIGFGGCVHAFFDNPGVNDDISTFTFNGDFYDDIAILKAPTYNTGHLNKQFIFNGNFIANSPSGNGILLTTPNFNSKLKINANYVISSSATTRSLISSNSPCLIDWTGNIDLPNTSIGQNLFNINNANCKVTFRGSIYDNSTGSPIINMQGGSFDWVGGRYESSNVKNAIVNIANNSTLKNISFRNVWSTLTGSTSGNTFVDILDGSSNGNIRFFNTFVKTEGAPIVRTFSTTSSVNVYFGNTVLENNGGVDSYNLNGTNTVTSVNSFANVAGVNTGGTDVGAITVNASVKAQ